MCRQRAVAETSSMAKAYQCAVDDHLTHAYEVGSGSDTTLCGKDKERDVKFTPEPFPGTREDRPACEDCRLRAF